MNTTGEILLSSTTTHSSPFRHVAMEDRRSIVTIVVSSAIFISIMLAIAVGNTVVIIAIATHRTLKNQQSNLFILNLAITDLMVVFGVMIWTSASLTMDYGRDESNPWALSYVRETLV